MELTDLSARYDTLSPTMRKVLAHHVADGEEAQKVWLDAHLSNEWERNGLGFSDRAKGHAHAKKEHGHRHAGTTQVLTPELVAVIKESPEYTFVIRY